MTAQSQPGTTPTARTADQWEQTFKQVLNRVAQQPYVLKGQEGGTNSKQISIRRLVFNQAEQILALKAKGATYATIANQLSDAGIPISPNVLKRYICDYRKQKHKTAATSDEKGDLKARLAGIRFS